MEDTKIKPAPGVRWLPENMIFAGSLFGLITVVAVLTKLQSGDSDRLSHSQIIRLRSDTMDAVSKGSLAVRQLQREPKRRSTQLSLNSSIVTLKSIRSMCNSTSRFNKIAKCEGNALINYYQEILSKAINTK